MYFIASSFGQYGRLYDERGQSKSTAPGDIARRFSTGQETGKLIAHGSTTCIMLSPNGAPTAKHSRPATA